jgi:hypothetical protein
MLFETLVGCGSSIREMKNTSPPLSPPALLNLKADILTLISHQYGWQWFFLDPGKTLDVNEKFNLHKYFRKSRWLERHPKNLVYSSKSSLGETSNGTQSSATGPRSVPETDQMGRLRREMGWVYMVETWGLEHHHLLLSSLFFSLPW